MQNAVLSEEVGRLMAQVPPLIEPVGATLFQSANQNPSINECCQFGSPSKKIKKEQKGQDKLKSSNKKNTRGSRGQKRKIKTSNEYYQTFKHLYILDMEGIFIKMLFIYLWIFQVIFTFNIKFTISFQFIDITSNTTQFMASSLDCFLSEVSEIELIYIRIIATILLILNHFDRLSNIYISHLNKFLNLNYFE
ncbi:unnamed protein product [Paramecium primaurelia]|uniref:Transmembrane protein n=1 Tax=Paramecium primaurelia TaxID=5886 RepID=A0A8S1QEA0_PARPR|nr:unnamed protein product [Paramecium primaurelia]